MVRSSVSRGLIKYRFCGPVSDPRVEQLTISDEGQALQGPHTQEVFLLHVPFQHFRFKRLAWKTPEVPPCVTVLSGGSSREGAVYPCPGVTEFLGLQTCLPTDPGRQDGVPEWLFLGPEVALHFRMCLVGLSQKDFLAISPLNS